MNRTKINSKQVTLAAILAVALVLSACTRSDSGDSNGSSSPLCVVDSSSDSGGSGVEIECGSFEYEGQTYKTVVIGTQTWMAENLNYNVKSSSCYGDYSCPHPDACPACYAIGGMCYGYKGSYYVVVTDAKAQANCDKYGRLYKWVTAMALDPSCDSINCTDQISAKHKGICPYGWHIPTQAEWDTLSSYVENDNECSSCTAKHLKATSGWNSCGNGLNTYGFAALPGGGGATGGIGSIDSYGYWWSATEYDNNQAYLSFMFYGSESVHRDYFYKRNSKFSVRCVMD